jgi:hypothetical protein
MAGTPTFTTVDMVVITYSRNVVAVLKDFQDTVYSSRKNNLRFGLFPGRGAELTLIYKDLVLWQCTS